MNLRAEKTFYLIGFVLLVVAPWLVSPYNLSLLGRFLAYAILALGLVLVWGEAGILSLGQGLFFGLGGYVLAMYLKLVNLAPGDLPDFMQWSGVSHLPAWWAIFRNPVIATLGVAAVPAAVAAAFAWLVFHRRVGTVYFALITQAMVLAFVTLLSSEQGYTGGFNGLTDFHTLYGLSLDSQSVQNGLYWATVGVLAASFLGLKWLTGSHFGKLLRALSDSENRVRFLGYDSMPYKTIAFTIGAALAGIGGAFFTLQAGGISPAGIGVVSSIEMVVWVAVGGRRSLAGAIVGTLVVNFAQEMVSNAFPNVWPFAIGLMFILVVTLLPDGLGGLFRPGSVTALRARLRGLSGAAGLIPLPEDPGRDMRGVK